MLTQEKIRNQGMQVDRKLAAKITNERKDMDIVTEHGLPHVVQLVEDFDKKHESVCQNFILESCAATNLHRLLTSLRTSPSQPGNEERKQAFQWIKCLAVTLARLHQLDMRHRDIKHGNIHVDSQNVFYPDLGLAFDGGSDIGERPNSSGGG